MSGDGTKRSNTRLIASGIIRIVLLFVGSGAMVGAADFDADNHAEYCGCGTKCRREKCCCGPAEEPPVESVSAVMNSPETEIGRSRVTPVRTFRNLICRLVAPCGSDADAPASRVFRSFVPVASVSILTSFGFLDSKRFSPLQECLTISEVRERRVYRPPEVSKRTFATEILPA